MDFSLTSEQNELQKVARDFAQKEMMAVAMDMEKNNTPLPDEWHKKYAEMGFLGININPNRGRSFANRRTGKVK